MFSRITCRFRHVLGSFPSQRRSRHGGPTGRRGRRRQRAAARNVAHEKYRERQREELRSTLRRFLKVTHPDLLLHVNAQSSSAPSPSVVNEQSLQTLNAIVDAAMLSSSHEGAEGVIRSGTYDLHFHCLSNDSLREISARCRIPPESHRRLNAALGTMRRLADAAGLQAAHPRGVPGGNASRQSADTPGRSEGISRGSVQRKPTYGSERFRMRRESPSTITDTVLLDEMAARTRGTAPEDSRRDLTLDDDQLQFLNDFFLPRIHVRPAKKDKGANEPDDEEYHETDVWEGALALVRLLSRPEVFCFLRLAEGSGFESTDTTTTNPAFPTVWARSVFVISEDGEMGRKLCYDDDKNQVRAMVMTLPAALCVHQPDEVAAFLDSSLRMAMETSY